MFRNVEAQEASVAPCDACSRISLSHLSLDIAEPIVGWLAFFHERGIAVTPDDLGRPSVERGVLGELLAESREREARLAERPLPDSEPVAAGVPAAGEDLSAIETLMAQPDYTSLQAELGRPKPRFLDEELARGQRQVADERAEQEAVKRAQRVLDGRDE